MKFIKSDTFECICNMCLTMGIDIAIVLAASALVIGVIRWFSRASV